jgi:triphosphoribosyl-dephospho-CoA synthase
MTSEEESKKIRIIGNSAQIAGVLEASTEKPGNVTPKHDFSDTTYEDFIMGSIAMGRSVEKAAFRGYRAGRKEISVHDIGIGKLILEGIQDVQNSHEGGNTHLGTLMLFIPIAAAAGMCIGKGEKMSSIRKNISNIVEESSIEDSYCFYSAIKESGAGGISNLVEESMSFYELMKYSAQKDAIAQELSGGLETIFTLGLPTFESFYQEEENLRKALLKTYLLILTKHPDTFIAKKAGIEKARKVSELASKVMAGNLSPEAFDAELRTQGSTLNPGTTADLVSAILFIWLIYENLSN